MGQEDRDWYREKWKERLADEPTENQRRKAWPSSSGRQHSSGPRASVLDLLVMMTIVAVFVVILVLV